MPRYLIYLEGVDGGCDDPIGCRCRGFTVRAADQAAAEAAAQRLWAGLPAGQVGRVLVGRVTALRAADLAAWESARAAEAAQAQAARTQARDERRLARLLAARGLIAVPQPEVVDG